MSKHLEFERRHSLVPSGLPRTVVREGDYVAEIIEDRRNKPRLFFCVIRQEGSPEILALCQFFSYAEAELAASQELRKASRKAVLGS